MTSELGRYRRSECLKRRCLRISDLGHFRSKLGPRKWLHPTSYRRRNLYLKYTQIRRRYDVGQILADRNDVDLVR